MNALIDRVPGRSSGLGRPADPGEAAPVIAYRSATPQHAASSRAALLRARRGVPYLGVQRDVQEVLKAHLERGRELESLLQGVVGDVQALVPALDFLSHSADVPADVRMLATGYSTLANSLLQYMGGVRNGLDRWTFGMESALDAAQTADDHTPIDPRPWAIGRFGTDFRVLNRYGRSAVAVYADIDAFLNVHAHQLAPPPAYAHRAQTCELGAAPGPSGAGSGVQASTGGVPQAMQSYRSAYAAGWDTQARFFQMGRPIAHNSQHRRYQFLDRSYVDTQAHQPALATSLASDLALAGATAAGATLGGLVRGPVGALVGGGGTLAVAAAARPYDAAWQGYSARYYAAPGAQDAWGQRYFYGWRRSEGVATAVRIDGAEQPSVWANFADRPEAFSWWRWRHGHADPRAAVFDGCGQAQRLQAARAHAAGHGSTDQLVQALAGFAPHASASVAPAPTPAPAPLPLAAPCWPGPCGPDRT